MKIPCPNMNHGRLTATVKYCPSCGEKLNPKLITRCNVDKHKSLRKDRNLFCHECGDKLTS